MYLSIHAASGIIIGTLVPQPIAALGVGFISHFILDVVPHYDGDIPLKNQTLNKIAWQAAPKVIELLYIETSIILIITAVLAGHIYQFVTLPVLLGMIGAMLPDILQFLLLLAPRNYLLLQFARLHDTLHYHTAKPVAMSIGIITQVVTVGVFIITLLYIQ